MMRAIRSLTIIAAVSGAAALCGEDVDWGDLCGRSRELALTIRTNRIYTTGTCPSCTESGITLNCMFFPAAPVILAVGTPPCAIYDLINGLTIGGSHKITII